MKRTSVIIIGVLASFSLLPNLAGADGNRFGVERRYHSEVSASEAYRLINHDGNHGHAHHHHKPILIDVRSIPEYVAGHPEGALNIPYPNIHPDVNATLSDQDKINLLVESVKAAVHDKDTPILLLCRTGSRSVAAGNLLADAGYTHVRNIWEGFEGRTKTDVNGVTLDLNNDGVVGDAGDLDGWKNFAALPYSTTLKRKLIFKPYEYLYYQ